MNRLPKIIIALLIAIATAFFVWSLFESSPNLQTESTNNMPQSKIVESTVLDAQKNSTEDFGIKISEKESLSSKSHNESKPLSELEIRAIQLPKLVENNSFQILQNMRAENYSPNKDDWSYDSENYLTTYLADNPLNPSSDTKLVCDQQACLIESVLSSVDFRKTDLGVSKEWDDFNLKFSSNKKFNEFFNTFEKTQMVIPVAEENKQIRLLLYLRK